MRQAACNRISVKKRVTRPKNLRPYCIPGPAQTARLWLLQVDFGSHCAPWVAPLEDARPSARTGAVTWPVVRSHACAPRKTHRLKVGHANERLVDGLPSLGGEELRFQFAHF